MAMPGMDTNDDIRIYLKTCNIGKYRYTYTERDTDSDRDRQTDKTFNTHVISQRNFEG